MEIFLKFVLILNRFQSEVYLPDPQGNFSIEKIYFLPFLVLLLTTLTNMPLNFTFAADYAQDFTDTNGDGINDYVDLCTNQPEPFNGVFDRDGCPDN